MFLVSDDDSGNSSANRGLTLPEEVGATHNAGFSPLYLTRSGNANGSNIGERSLSNQLWSNIAHSFGTTVGYYANLQNINSQNTLPSLKFPRFYAYTLRCLVSTNNG